MTRRFSGLLPILLLPLLCQLGACAHQSRPWHFAGEAMAAPYHVTVVAPPRGLSKTTVRSEIQRELDDVDRLMSSYRSDSDVERFNRAPAGEWFGVSKETAQVVETALAIYRLSEGAFDITVAPLVDLWGFGPGEHGAQRIPDEAALRKARSRIGSQALAVRKEPPALRKDADREIDLSAIAQGFASDRVAAWLEAHGIGNYMVEVSGDIRVAGHNADGEAWRLGIETPESGQHGVTTTINLSDHAVTTSGTYRNYFEIDGKRYSHVLDPTTGRPVSRALVSVTVVAPDCITADALDTALNVMGPDRAMALAERNGIPIYLTVRTDNGTLEPRWSSAFTPLLAKH